MTLFIPVTFEIPNQYPPVEDLTSTGGFFMPSGTLLPDTRWLDRN